jgi:hypothetical protein
LLRLRLPALGGLRVNFMTGRWLREALETLSVAACTAIAPTTPPTAAPTGPAMLPMAAPATAPAASLEIGGTWTSLDPCELAFFFFGCARLAIRGTRQYL